MQGWRRPPGIAGRNGGRRCNPRHGKRGGFPGGPSSALRKTPASP